LFFWHVQQLLCHKRCPHSAELHLVYNHLWFDYFIVNQSYNFYITNYNHGQNILRRIPRKTKI